LKRRFILLFLVLLSTLSYAQEDSLRNTSSSKILKYIPSAACVLSGAIMYKNPIYDRFSVQNDISNNFNVLHTKADFFMQGVPYLLGYSMFFLGKEGKNDFLNKGLLLVKSQVLANGITYGLKYTLNVQRPDSSDNKSMPSGHTTRAFAAATWLHLEYGKEYPLLSILGYTSATAVGVLRMMNNEHWISDVLIGAAVGMASTHLIYTTHKYKWGKRITLAPYYMPQNGGFVLLINP
jgi:membrane-associated phospholipid phosphatase